MGLTAVVVKEDTGGPVQLGHNDALGTIDDEGTVLGHQGDLPHVNVLLFDILDGLRGRFLVVNDQANLDAQGTRIGGAARYTLVHVEYGLTQRVVHVLQGGIATVAHNRENRFERRVQSMFPTAVKRDAVLSELTV